MKKVRLSYLRWSVLTVFLGFILFASVSSEIGEWYALFIYPYVSNFLSAISSWLSFSLDEWGIVFALLIFMIYPFYLRKFKKKRWVTIVGSEVEFLLWIYVWFYWGWGINYYRADFFQRAGVKPEVYNEVRFREFIQWYTDGLKQAYRDCEQEGWVRSPDLFRPMQTVDGILQKKFFTPKMVQDEIKYMYQQLPSCYGLCQPKKYQRPKYSSFNRLYSSVGVLGFMGPFFTESHVNLELSVLEYPFTYAHELSHLLGISSEAEANLWAFTVCSQNKHPLIRLSGYMGLLSYVRSNASYLLSTSDFEEWESSLLPEITAAFYRIHAYWSLRYNPVLGEMQSALYTFYLKRNKIPSGQKNYAQAIGMLLSLPCFHIPLQ